MTVKKKPMTNSDKIKLVMYLANNAKSLNGLTLNEIKEKAERELKMYLVTSTVRRTIDEGGFGIKYNSSTASKSNFIAVMFARLNRIESAYMDLCKQVGIDPVDMSAPVTLNNEDNG